jgi:SNF2 family DNA or RNA helicase
MEIIDGKALKLRLRNPHKVLSVIPKSTLLEEGDVSTVMVHWGLEEAQVLKNLRIKNVPSPIIAKYKWPGIYQPFTHQKQTSAFLTLHRKAFCFSEPGTGKTLSVAWACDYLMNAKHIKRVLIICPLSIMQSAWQNDLFKGAMHRKVGVAYGTKEKRQKIIHSDAEFVIINFDGVNIVEEDIIKAKFDMVVVDEANAYKTATTTRWKTLNRILLGNPDSWLWMLTGTPASQSPLDAYGLAKLVNPAAAPRSFTLYRDQVMNKITQFKWAPKKEAEQTVRQLLQPAIRFTKDECLDLPDLLYSEREVPMTPQQVRYYEKLRKVMAMQAAGEEVTAVNAAAKLNKLLQISCGAVYSDSGEIVSFDSSSRTAVLKEVIDESSHKVLVFAPYRHAIDILYEELRKDGYMVDVIHGGIPAGRRTEIFRKFQDEPDPQVLVIQPQAASHGVTLHAANTIVWWAPITSYETYAQANARIHRAGQTNKCLVVKLQGSPVEAKLYKALENKETAQTSLMELYRDAFDLDNKKS